MESLIGKAGEVREAKEFMDKLASMSPERREHMRIVVKALVECYTREDAHAVLVISEDKNPFGELLTINCNDMEALHMLQQVRELMTEVVTADAPPKEMMN